jgi:hypothetical protein
MSHTHPFDQALPFDMGKLPTELQTLSSAELTEHLRAVFELAMGKAHDRAVALEITHQVLFHVTTDRRWEPAKGALRAHLVAMMAGVYGELRFGGSWHERRACAGFAAEQGNRSASPEQLALYVEEQPLLERRDAADAAALAAVVEAMSGNPIAPRLFALWAEHGPDLVPRDIAERLGVAVKDVHRTIELVRRHAKSRKVENARRRAEFVFPK